MLFLMVTLLDILEPLIDLLIYNENGIMIFQICIWNHHEYIQFHKFGTWNKILGGFLLFVIIDIFICY